MNTTYAEAPAQLLPTPSDSSTDSRARVAGADPPDFPRRPGETPRAFAAFLAYFQLGQERSLPAVAEALGEHAATVKNWSSKYRWSDRLHAFYSRLLESQAESEVARQHQQAADWARRIREFREQEWVAGQKLLEAVLCFLESFGDREVEKMSLGQVSRALQISSRISRQALRGDLAADEPAAAPLQVELVAALKKAYGLPATPASAPEPPPPHP